MPVKANIGIYVLGNNVTQGDFRKRSEDTMSDNENTSMYVLGNQVTHEDFR